MRGRAPASQAASPWAGGTGGGGRPWAASLPDRLLRCQPCARLVVLEAVGPRLRRRPAAGLGRRRRRAAPRPPAPGARRAPPCSAAARLDDARRAGRRARRRHQRHRRRPQGRGAHPRRGGRLGRRPPAPPRRSTRRATAGSPACRSPTSAGCRSSPGRSHTGTPLTVHDRLRRRRRRAGGGRRLHPDVAGAHRPGPDRPDRFRTDPRRRPGPAGRPPANVVATYGMTETGSGVAYDGVPLDGVEVRVGDDGEIQRARPDAAALLPRRHRPPDAPTAGSPPATSARLVDGVLHVHGRRGDLIITGGENVWPAAVERALARRTPAWPTWPWSGDPTRSGASGWSPSSSRSTRPRRRRSTTCAAHVKATLPAAAAPRGSSWSTALPRTASGKVRRRDLVAPRAPRAAGAGAEQGAAVDDEGLAGDPRREVAGQEQRARRRCPRARRGDRAASTPRSAPRSAPTAPGPCPSSRGPGAIALTRTPGASSAASVRVRCRSAALVPL